MSSAAPVLNPGAPAAPKRRLRLSIRAKFVGFTVLLIIAVMGAVGYSLYQQQRQALGKEVLGRGRTLAENLATVSRDFLATSDLLNLSLLANKAVQPAASLQAQARVYDPNDPQDWGPGLKQAYDELLVEMPLALSRSWKLLTEGASLAGPGAAPKALAVENEGIFEAVIVDADGMVASHYLGTDEVGKPYKAPRAVASMTVDKPYPIYELKDQDGRRRRLFHLDQTISDQVTGKVLGSVHLGLSVDLVDRVIFKATFKLAAIAILAILFGMLATYLVVSFLTAPIGRLGKGVLAIAGGDFNTQVKVSSRDELGELTNAFNKMAVSLSQNETLKGAFTRYVSDAALKRLLSDPSKSGLHSQRTLATIYTSDVRGFTAMSESLPPEEVVQVINTYLGLQTDIILKHGGVVDKFIGDATIGVWGKEAPAPDDALKAVKAAWEAQKAIAKLNIKREAKGEVVKLVGIGVNTGEVVSGNMGSSKKMEYTVTGEHVIFADQICAECPGGMVWISQSTYDAVKDDVVVVEQELKPKGKGKKGVTVYEVTGFR